jgi:hypothetical protein
LRVLADENGIILRLKQKCYSEKGYNLKQRKILMKYTCTDYRTEMILLSLRQRLKQEDLNEAEKKDILLQIEEIEAAMELD